MGDGLIPGPFPESPSPTPSSSPTYTRPSAKGLSLGSTMLTTESLQQTVSCSPFPSPGVLTMAAEGWCFPPLQDLRDTPHHTLSVSPRHRSGEGGSCIQT